MRLGGSVQIRGLTNVCMTSHYDIFADDVVACPSAHDAHAKRESATVVCVVVELLNPTHSILFSNTQYCKLSFYRRNMTDQKASCPYAVSLSDDEDAGSSELQVRHALLEVPPSHLEKRGHFYRALRHLHHVSQTLELQDSKFAVAGGCPVSFYSPDTSFAGAMEEYSLASIMARMAQDLEQQEEQEQEDGSEKMAPTITNGTEKASVVIETPPPPPPQQSSAESTHQVRLSEALKTGTAASHQAAEDVHFVRNFIKGSIDRTLYAELVLSLYHVYTQLEESLNEHAPRYFPTCHFPNELSRKGALEEDVDFWHGSVPERISPATRDYVQRLEYLAKTDPLLLLAHAYTRYLGDLSGGKILARVARKAMQLEQEGLEFYEFPHVKSAKLFKDQYRTALDELHLTPTQVSKLVAEANVAFVLNMRLFEELDVMANIPGASVRDFSEALEYANATTTNETSRKECPFAKMGGEINKVLPKKRMSVPWPFVVGLVLCGFWWGIQTFVRAEVVEEHNPIAEILEPFQEWDRRGPWI